MPIHIAARYGSIDCLLWIANVNKHLTKNNKQCFDWNNKGKNGFTPLHLTLSAFKYKETSFLVNIGCDLFSKSFYFKRPKNVTNNFYLIKMMTLKENEFLYKKYVNQNNKIDIYSNYNLLNHIDNKFIFDDQFNSLSSNNSFEINNDKLFSKNVSFLSKKNYIYKLKYSNLSISKIEQYMKQIISKINLLNEFSLMVDLCDIILNYRIINLIPLLELTAEQIPNNIYYIRKKIDNTIILLLSFTDNNIIKNYYENLFGDTIIVNEYEDNLDEEQMNSSITEKNDDFVYNPFNIYSQN